MFAQPFTQNSFSMLPRTPLHRWIAVAIFLTVSFYYIPTLTGYSITHSSTKNPEGFPTNPVEEASWVKDLLRENKIGPEIEFASRIIRYVPDAGERRSMTHVDSKLFPDSFTNLSISSRNQLPTGKVVDVHVKQSPRPDQVDASKMIFGASTTYARFKADDTSPIKEFTRWLTDGKGHSNGAGLILALFEATELELDAATQSLETIGINATVIPADPSLDMPGRYVDLVRMLYNHPTRAARKYFVLIDDDTFFPCMNQLMKTLDQYDPDKPYYIGTFTERADWMMQNGAPFAYGGGGIVLTAPTAKQLTELPCTEKKPEGGYVLNADQGDRLLYNCLRNNTEITLTYLPLLRQLDQFGDPAGVYESGQQHLSFHHYKSWHSARPDLFHVVADACGEACVLQRFQFSDNFIISNGYTVAEYPQGIDFNPDQIEGTFSANVPDNQAFEETTFSYVFGQLRKSLSGTGRKRAWALLGARKEGDGRVKQVYLKSRSDVRWFRTLEEAPERDSVVVLTWIP